MVFICGVDLLAELRRDQADNNATNSHLAADFGQSEGKKTVLEKHIASLGRSIEDSAGGIATTIGEIVALKAGWHQGNR